MSNFAEFDVPEPNNTISNETSEQTEQKQNIKPEKQTVNKHKPRKTNIWSTILTIIGYIALTITAIKIYGLFNSNLQYPFQYQLATLTLPIMLTAYIAFKLSTKNPLSKLGLLGTYILFAIFAVDKIYAFITTGAISWA